MNSHGHFIKKMAAGLAFPAVGAVRGAEPAGTKTGKRRLFGIPDSVRRSTPVGRNPVRFSPALTDILPLVWDEVVPLGLYAGR